MKYVIGLTGQSGSGKSVVADILAQYGAYVVDCDALAHKNMKHGGVAYDDIVQYFGIDILNADNEINRRCLAAIVFNDSKKLEALNKITHRYIYEYICDIIKHTDSIVVIDAPLLFEAGLDKLCDAVWSVVCPDDIRLERVTKRDNITAEQARERFKNQKNAEFFYKNSDIVIENSSDLEFLKERVVYEINKILV